MVNIDNPNFVTQTQVSQEDIMEAESLEMNPEMMMRLIDLIFLCREDSTDLPS